MELFEKTPVSLLQEYLILQKKVPCYELIKNGVGTHNPEFTFRLRVDSIFEEGTGRSKQEAKHKAAEKMLKALKVVKESTTEDDYVDGVVKTENFVGFLKEFCLLQNYPTPQYWVEEAAGPPHSKIFKMVCSVSQLQEFGVCKTKKSAKQKAAHKMLETLQHLIKRDDGEQSTPKKVTKVPEISLKDDEIIEKYNNLKTVVAPVGKHPAAYYKDHEKAYIHLREESPILDSLLKENRTTHFRNLYNLVCDIAKELDVEVTKTSVPAKKELNHDELVVLTMTVVPSISGMGFNVESAAASLLETLTVLCE